MNEGINESRCQSVAEEIIADKVTDELGSSTLALVPVISATYLAHETYTRARHLSMD